MSGDFHSSKRLFTTAIVVQRKTTPQPSDQIPSICVFLETATNVMRLTPCKRVAFDLQSKYLQSEIDRAIKSIRKCIMGQPSLRHIQKYIFQLLCMCILHWFAYDLYIKRPWFAFICAACGLHIVQPLFCFLTLHVA